MNGRKWLRRGALAAGVVAALLVVAAVSLRLWLADQQRPSGGVLRPRQAAYDVRRYELDLRLDPATRSLAGNGRTIAVATAPLGAFELQLDDALTVTAARVDGAPVPFRHRRGLITVELAQPWTPGERHTVEIDYGGRPKVAARPPWLDGLVWAETPSGAPWLGVTVQGDGADDWWPCKDHPSDEPDEGVAIALTLPSDLVALSNGRKVGETVHPDGTTTTRWETRHPINNYLVTFNAAPYVPIEATYARLHGDRNETIVFWAIPEHREAAERLWREQGPAMLASFARRYGEYPWLDEKFHVAETPYLGMEHQTIVAYGAKFENNAYGFDELLFHETAHEWWGNKVTARDWGDFWLQEGFATYAVALHVLDSLGEERYLDYMRGVQQGIRNRQPIVAGSERLAAEAYIGDIYSKGAAVLHTLRWQIGSATFDRVLHEFANARLPADGLVDTADFERLVEESAGADLSWFWQRYLYRAAPPRWTLERGPAGQGRETVTVRWDDPAFQLALPVRVAGEERRVEMPGGIARFEVAAGAVVEIDPRGRILAEPAKGAFRSRLSR